MANEIVLRTDKYEIRIYPATKKIYFHRIRVLLGEIVADKAHKFVLQESDFRNYREGYRTMVQWLANWV